MEDRKYFYTIINEAKQLLHLAVGQDAAPDIDIFYINIGETEAEIKRLFPLFSYCPLPPGKNIRLELLSKEIAIGIFTVVSELETITCEYPHHKEIIIRNQQKTSPQIIQ